MHPTIQPKEKSPERPASSTETGNNFDFLRFLLAALVIFSHSFALTGAGGREPLSLLTRGQTYLGEISVDGFFAISGFLITASWLRSRTVWSYLSKRALRIYPGFLVVCALCAFLFGPLGAGSASLYFHQLSALQFLRHALLLDKLALPASFRLNPVPDQINGSLWTIKIEGECYLLVAALGLVGAFRRRAVPLGLLLLGCAAVLVETLVPTRHHVSETAGEHLRFFLFFLAGMVFFLYRDKIVYRFVLLLGALLILVAGASLHALDAILTLPLTYLLMYAAFAPSGTLARFGQKRDLSYGLYLYAWPIQQLLVLLGGKSLGPSLLFLVSLPLTALCAGASWRFIEKPCLRLKRSPAQPQEMDSVAPETLPAHQPSVPGAPLKGPTISGVIQPP